MALMSAIIQGIKKWLRAEDGVAAIEAAMLFPLMVALMAGSFDLGQGIVLSGRTVTASQVVADLISRDKTANLTSVNDDISAAQLVYQPFSLSEFGIDIASVQFDTNKKPVVLWRETRSMSPNTAAIDSLVGVGAAGDGMIVVTVQYTYKPLFTQYFASPVQMSEVAFARGRRSPAVTWGG